MGGAARGRGILRRRCPRHIPKPPPRSVGERWVISTSGGTTLSTSAIRGSVVGERHIGPYMRGDGDPPTPACRLTGNGPQHNQQTTSGNHLCHGPLTNTGTEILGQISSHAQAPVQNSTLSLTINSHQPNNQTIKQTSRQHINQTSNHQPINQTLHNPIHQTSR